MNPYHEYVTGLAKLVESGQSQPLGGFAMPKRPEPASDAPVALIFAPHPDDEVIIGGLALRLLRESGWRVINVAVTQGSNKARQAERWAELRECCRYIGFGLVPTVEGGLEGVTPKTRATRPEEWARLVQCIGDILVTHTPRAIFFPHDDDWNGTHLGTHHLVVDALKGLSPAFQCFTVETEFWGAMDNPNLLVESSTTDVSDLIAALSFHVGEVRRNPYHLLMPAWMMDNVRRGGELVGGQGGAAPHFLFGTLYRLRRWQQGRFQSVITGGKFLAANESPVTLFAS